MYVKLGKTRKKVVVVAALLVVAIGMIIGLTANSVRIGNSQPAFAPLAASEHIGQASSVFRPVEDKQEPASEPPAASPLGADTNQCMETTERLVLPPNVREYVSQPGGFVFLKSFVTSRLTKDDLPFLYAALGNDRFARQWSKVIFAICVLEDGGKALSVAEEFLSTPWEWQSTGIAGHEATLVIRTIMMSVVCTAMLDPAFSRTFLEKTFNREGAEDFLQGWRVSPFPENSYMFDNLVSDYRTSVVTALLYSRSPELFSAVEAEFELLSSKSKFERTHAESALFVACWRAMAKRDLYNEMGWDKGIRYIAELDSDEELRALQRFMEPYIESTEDSAGPAE